MQQFLLISLLCENNPTLIQALSAACAQSQCEVVNSRISNLGQHHVGHLLAGGSWSALAKLENQLKTLIQAHGSILQYHRTTATEYKEAALPYVVQIIGVNTPTLLNTVLDFFMQQELNLSDIAIQQYATAQTNTAMLSIQANILIPANLHLAHIRESFIVFCDEQNLEAIFEPDRN